MPSLEKLNLHFRNGPFILVAVDVGEKREAVRKFIDSKNFSFTVLLDKDSHVSEQYGVRSHPMKFLIDKKGDLIGVSLGYREWDKEEMKRLLNLLLNS